MSDNVREALGVLASKWATGSSDDLADDTYQRAFNAARYRCAQELRAALAAPSSESPAATGSGDEADRLDALRAQRSVVTRNYARDPSNENEAALYAICERVYAAERKVAAATGSGAATGPRDEAEVAWCIMRKDRTLLGNRTWTSRLGAELELACCRMEMPRTTEAEDFRVVALVPQRQQGGAR